MLKRLLLLIAVLVTSGCDGWVEKVAPAETAFARHCFSLLQRRDFAAIEAIAAPELRTADFESHLSDMAALVPREAPIFSEAVNVNVSTTNGYATSTVGIEYEFRGSAFAFDIATEGSGDSTALTWISLRPIATPEHRGFMAAFFAIPITVLGLALIGVIIYRRRFERREALRTTPAMLERRSTWSVALEDASRRTPWFLRQIGIRRIDLTSPLDAEECKRRLRESIVGEFALSRWGGPRTDFQGTVGKSRFRISRKQSLLFSSHYQTFLHGRLAPQGAGSSIRCSLGPQRVILGLAAGSLVILWAIFLSTIIRHGGFPSFAIVGPLLMTAVAGGGLAINGRRVRKEGPVLLDFLGETLTAVPAPSMRLGSVEGTTQR